MKIIMLALGLTMTTKVRQFNVLVKIWTQFVNKSHKKDKKKQMINHLVNIVVVTIIDKVLELIWIDVRII